MGTESKIESKACEYARARGFYVRKFASPAQRGVPDRLFLSPCGDVLFIEFKAPGKAPTALQQREIELIRANGGMAYCIDSLRRAKEVIDSFV